MVLGINGYSSIGDWDLPNYGYYPIGSELNCTYTSNMHGSDNAILSIQFDNTITAIQDSSNVDFTASYNPKTFKLDITVLYAYQGDQFYISLYNNEKVVGIVKIMVF